MKLHFTITLTKLDSAWSMAKDRQDLGGPLGRLQLEVVGQRQLAVLGAAGVLGPRPLELTSF